MKDAGFGGKFELRQVESADNSMSPLQVRLITGFSLITKTNDRPFDRFGVTRHRSDTVCALLQRMLFCKFTTNLESQSSLLTEMVSTASLASADESVADSPSLEMLFPKQRVALPSWS